MNGRAASGLGLAVLSAASFGASGSFATGLLDAGWSPGATVTMRVSLAALVLTVPALLAVRGRSVDWAALARTSATYGAFAVATAQLCFFQAVERLPVGVALLLEYSGVLLVVGWLWARHGQRPRRLTVAGTVAAVLGLLLVLDLAGNARLDLFGVLWGLGAAVGLAVYFVMSANQSELPPLVVAWGGLSCGALVLGAAGLLGVLPMVATTADVTLLHTHVPWVVPMLGLGLVAGAIAYVSGIGGARLLGARLASFVGLTEVLFAVLLAFVLLGQQPGPVQLVGGLVVLAGISLVRLDELRGGRLTAPATPVQVGAPG